MTSPCCRAAFLDMLRRLIPAGTVSHASVVLPFVVVVVALLLVVDVVAVEFCAEASAKKSRLLLLSLVE